MNQVDPKLYPKPVGQLQVAPVRHGSTLGGTAVTMAAAHATLQQLTPEAHARLARLGDHFRGSLNALGDELGMPLQATGAQHLFGLHWTKEPVVDMTTAMTSDRRMIHTWNLFLYNRGFYIFPNANGIVSTPMTEADIDTFVDAMREILSEGRDTGWLEY
jgi:glutamate-1-semialdehyde 2,1-aminomutase